MEIVPGTDVQYLPLARHTALLQSLGRAASRACNSGSVTVPLLSALNVCFPRALRTSVSLDVGRGLVATVGDLLRLGPATLGFCSVDQSIVGLTLLAKAPVSTVSKAGRLQQVTGFKPDDGSSRITCVPVFDLTRLSESQQQQNVEAASSLLLDDRLAGMQQIIEAMQQHAECIGCLTLVTGKDIHVNVQHSCYKNLLLMAICISCHLLTESQPLLQQVRALLGISAAEQPYALLAPGTSYLDDGPHNEAVVAEALLEDVEAELSYDSLDEDYLRQVQREAGVMDASDEEDEEGTNRGYDPCNVTSSHPNMNRDHDHDNEPSCSMWLPPEGEGEAEGISCSARSPSSHLNSQDAAGSGEHSRNVENAAVRDTLQCRVDAAHDEPPPVFRLQAADADDELRGTKLIAEGLSWEDGNLHGTAWADDCKPFTSAKAAVAAAHHNRPRQTMLGVLTKHAFLAAVLMMWLLKMVCDKLSICLSVAVAAVLTVLLGMLIVTSLRLGPPRFLLWVAYAPPRLLLLTAMVPLLTSLLPEPKYLPGVWHVPLTWLPVFELVRGYGSCLEYIALAAYMSSFGGLHGQCRGDMICLLVGTVLLFARYYLLSLICVKGLRFLWQHYAEGELSPHVGPVITPPRAACIPADCSSTTAVCDDAILNKTKSHHGTAS